MRKIQNIGKIKFSLAEMMDGNEPQKEATFCGSYNMGFLDVSSTDGYVLFMYLVLIDFFIATFRCAHP